MDAITESPGQYWPVSHKYDTIDRKYKFFKAAYAFRMQTYYPLIQLGDSVYSSSRRSANNLKSQISNGSEVNVNRFTADSNVKETLITINDLSNDILLAIFSYCHPIDLIHCFSLVCRRWNYLANHPTLFTEVRVIVNGLSLKYDSVKTFFQRTSQYLRKLCIDCSVPLPSTRVNALFDICFPNVIHLDIGSFKEMNTTLLEKLSYCFPNVKTLHLERLKRCSSRNGGIDEWKQTLKMLFEDENIFPKVQNFFIGDISDYGPKLPACKRPLNLLHIHNGAGRINFSEIRTSAWRLTLTELFLEFIENEDIEYIGLLQNLKVFSLNMSLYAFDEHFVHIKNLHNLEELRIYFGGEDCNISSTGLIDLFTLPERDPENSFPFKLQHLIIASFYGGTSDLFDAIDQNCPNLKTLGIPYNKYSIFHDEIMPSIIKNFKNLVFLDLSHLGDCYKDEIWSNLSDDDLPNLRFLRLHGNKVNIESLQRLNLRRRKLLISTKRNYLINWTETENGFVFHDTFNGDIRAVMNDLYQIDGFRGCVIYPGISIHEDAIRRTLERSSSVDDCVRLGRGRFTSDDSV
ncbi:unnamed protein product [Cercopithifilaria johnstoni]|uniref:F-box domain-containing protein n=1 Tax=Cercopithifilaria johnstoni TaxID=2874296 RepID=A0A8J2MJY3_9BILA|nr:unnamed protein product [Cercopithifilaria johnstoni]